MPDFPSLWNRISTRCYACGNIAIRWFLMGLLLGMVGNFLMIVALNYMSGYSYETVHGR